MSDTIKDAVLEELTKIKAPSGSGSLISEDCVSDVFVTDGKIMFSITVPADQAHALEPLRRAAEDAARSVKGVKEAMVVLTAERKGGAGKNAAPAQAPAQQVPAAKQTVGNIKHIVAVASGKGGVGKSTTALNIALGLQTLGLKVGILDADVYGPSMPRMLGLTDKPESAGKMLKPLEGYGLKVMSMGFLVEEDAPIIWRGPMVTSALNQMLREVAWGALDVLILDMPPGTGDAQLSLAQKAPMSGAVIVSTPQDIALIDARKGLNMFNKVHVPILGIVENMSYFLCPSCGDRTDIFGHGGAEDEAKKLGVPFIGAVPLHLDIRTNSDNGTPIVASQPDSDHAQIYKNLAKNIWNQIDANAATQKPAPKISMS